MGEHITLKEGQWFTYPLDRGIPARVTIYERVDGHVRRVTIITKMQALALVRWHGHQGLYFSHKDGNGNWRDVHVVGDMEAWMNEGERSASL